MAKRGITLTRSKESIEAIDNRGDGFRVQIVASDGLMMPEEVFLFKQNLLNPKTGMTGEEFCAVASPEDIVCFPVDAPKTGQSPPFFRKDTIDVIVGSRKTVLDLWDAVKKQVCELVLALNRKDRLVVVETTRCGDTEDVTSESSTSVSLSESVSESVLA